MPRELHEKFIEMIFNIALANCKDVLKLIAKDYNFTLPELMVLLPSRNVFVNYLHTWLEQSSPHNDSRSQE